MKLTRLRLYLHNAVGLLLSISLATVAYGENKAADIASIINPAPSEPPTKRLSGYDRIYGDVEFQLTLAVLIFALLVLCIQFLVLWTWKGQLTSETMLKVSTITLVIFSTLFLITAGFNSEQIAPAMGLLGTIVGYVLGRESK
jgi:hypothetical protein